MCGWQAHFKKLANNNNKLCLAYVMISTGYISYTSLFAACTLPPDLTKTRLVNELCNLLKSSHIMWKKLKTLSRPTGCILSTQSWQLRAWQTPLVLGCTLCSLSWVSHPFSTGDRVYANSVAQELWHMPIATECSPALLCPQDWWSSLQSTVTAAVPCASYTNLLHAQDLHFPKTTHSFVQCENAFTY